MGMDSMQGNSTKTMICDSSSNLKWDVPKISTPWLHIKWALIYATTHYEGVTLLLNPA
jgi:hypothetical protein